MDAARAVLRVLRRRAAVLVLAGAGVPAAPLAAQIPDTFENLQVLPKDISRDSLVGIMRGFALSLGVRCDFCHMEKTDAAAGGAGGGLNLNFASDERITKRKARFMLRMVDSLNRVVLPALAEREDPPVAVRCITCHRGLSVPTTIEAVLLAKTRQFSVDSAIAEYRRLRADMASGHYDFREFPVTEVARTLGAQGRHADAIRLLGMLQEFYPSSVNIDLQIADLHIAAGERDQGIARLRAVLAKNPNDRRARQRLTQLGVTP